MRSGLTAAQEMRHELAAQPPEVVASVSAPGQAASAGGDPPGASVAAADVAGRQCPGDVTGADLPGAARAGC